MIAILTNYEKVTNVKKKFFKKMHYIFCFLKRTNIWFVPHLSSSCYFRAVLMMLSDDTLFCCWISVTFIFSLFYFQFRWISLHWWILQGFHKLFIINLFILMYNRLSLSFSFSWDVVAEILTLADAPILLGPIFSKTLSTSCKKRNLGQL